jgi:CRP-like cAMP-binding protein
MSYSIRSAGGNTLLASLPPLDEAYLASISRIVHPPRGRILTARSVAGSDVWFPHTGVVALTATDEAGRSVQTGVIGPEGCVGLQALFGSTAPLPDAVVQIEGTMSLMSASQFKFALSERPAIQVALSRFLFSLSVQSLQTVACNRLHTLSSRCCRWLLTMQDAAASDDLPLTQENLAVLLGSGRPRITRMLATLEQTGLLRRRRGGIRLPSRAALEANSCECYRVVRRISESLDPDRSRNPTVTTVTDS